MFRKLALQTFLFVVLGCCIAVFAVDPLSRLFGNYLIINNRSVTLITSIEVWVNEIKQTVGPLQPGESVTLALGYHERDCGIEIKAIRQDSTAVSGGTGYLSSGVFGQVFEVDVIEPGIFLSSTGTRSMCARSGSALR
ncbi:MAG: hypothetical protein JNL67_04385 [Planctomycetaceae bacterium]|nr:hypothetical protein [Planctomycetaceae bacterium]